MAAPPQGGQAPHWSFGLETVNWDGKSGPPFLEKAATLFSRSASAWGRMLDHRPFRWTLVEVRASWEKTHQLGRSLHQETAHSVSGHRYTTDQPSWTGTCDRK